LLQRLPVSTPKSYAKREKREFNYIFLKPEEEQLDKMPQDSKDTKRLQVIPEHTKQQQCDPQTAQ
jgi:hypothetical protein